MDVLVTEETIARQTPEAQGIIRSLLEVIERQQITINSLLARVDELTARVQELETALDQKNKTPLNSSVPPSTEHPHAKSLAAGPPTKRPRGGQPGHPKHQRTLLDPEDCNEVVPLKPTCCRSCGKALEGIDSDPLRHQVWEIPQPQPVVIEYQRHRLTCSCGCSTCAPLPEGVPEHTSGPRLVATAVFLMACCRLSKSRAAFALMNLIGVPVSPALMVKLQQQATAALTPCYEELKAALPETTVVNCDETPTKEGSKKAWIWVVAAPIFTVFAIALTRAASVIENLLGATYRGVMSSDRYGGYNAYNRQRQLCWAHLKRDFQALVDAGGEAQIVGQQLLSYLHMVFDHWHDYLGGKISRAALKRRIDRDVTAAIWQTINAGREATHGPTRALCRDLSKRWRQLWRFLDHAGVDPTNNRAEQVLRHAVIWRKLSFGTQSAAGSRFVETMLSVIETSRQQGRNLLDVLTAAVEARQNGQAPLSLLNEV
jgi:transposase